MNSASILNFLRELEEFPLETQLEFLKCALKEQHEIKEAYKLILEAAIERWGVNENENELDWINDRLAAANQEIENNLKALNRQFEKNIQKCDPNYPPLPPMPRKFKPGNFMPIKSNDKNDTKEPPDLPLTPPKTF
jgi:hypothetical protein